MKKNDVLTIRIEDMGVDGEGIGKVDNIPLFVKDALIGDVVSVKIMKMKKNYGYARLLEILEPSKDRVTPPCEFHRSCGGCQIQALSYEKQLEFKQRKIRNNLKRIGGFSEEMLEQVMEPIIGMDEPYHYRNKAQFPVGRDREGRTVTGFYAGRTHTIIPNRNCLLGMPMNEKILETVLSFMEKYQIEPYDEKTNRGVVRHVLTRYGHTTKEWMVCLVMQQLHVPYTKKYARNIYLQHPDRNNLWGISDLLALYDISNVSISMSDKEDIDRLSVPFLAEFSQDLVLVTQCNSDFVEIVWKNSLVKIARQQFFRSWTGVVTLLEKTEQSAEPNYVLHLKQQRKEQIESFLFWTFLAIVTVFGFVNKGYAVSPWLIGALLLNVCGAVVCALLTIQHINRGGGVVDKICSVFTKANCHQVLDSRESRVAGYHLSEIGLAFFVTNVSAFCILPDVFVSWYWLHCPLLYGVVGRKLCA